MRNMRETVPDGQFRWGAVLLKSNGGAYYGHLGANGNRADSVMAKGGLTARRTCQAGAKAEHSEPTVRIRCGRRLTDKSYSGDGACNKALVVPPRSNSRKKTWLITVDPRLTPQIIFGVIRRAEYRGKSGEMYT